MDEKEAVVRIVEFLSGRIAVGFNINFEKRVIDRMLKNNFNSRFNNPVIEINDLARRVDQPVNRIYPDRHQNLKDLCERFNIPLEDHHTAGGDAFASAQLFLKIISKLKKRGVTTWGQLRK